MALLYIFLPLSTLVKAIKINIMRMKNVLDYCFPAQGALCRTRSPQVTLDGYRLFPGLLVARYSTYRGCICYFQFPNGDLRYSGIAYGEVHQASSSRRSFNLPTSYILVCNTVAEKAWRDTCLSNSTVYIITLNASILSSHLFFA